MRVCVRLCKCVSTCFIHVPYQRDHALYSASSATKKSHVDFLAKIFNTRSFYMFMIQTERWMLIPLHACAAADTMLTSPSTEKAWSQEIGGKDLEPVWWSSQLPVQNGTCVVLRTEPLITMFICTSHVSCVAGNSIPLIFRGFHLLLFWSSGVI